MSQRRKLAVIFALAVLFAAVLVFRPWEFRDESSPRFFDRLPDADLIGKAQVLELSEMMKSTTYHFKVPFREFFTREFILQQSKAFGIDVQNPVYFFANESNWEIQEFGVMIRVKDSAMVNSGIKSLSKFSSIKDTALYENTVYKTKNVYLAYGSDWFLIYSGKNFKRVYHDVLFARRNEIPPNWRSFLNRAKFKNSPIVAKLNTKTLKDFGISHVDLRMRNDSTSMTISTAIHQIDSISIALKPTGPIFKKQEFTRVLANVHLDISKLREKPEDPIIRILKHYANKISFPLNDFLTAWEGDLAMRQGGLQTYREKYIESELDENFNVTEVTKYKSIKVPGYSAYLSMNSNYPKFLERLLTKGILTKPDSRYRFLFSPPLEIEKDEKSIAVHTASYYERPETGSENSVMFTMNQTQYTVHLDSLHAHTYFCRIHIPLKKMMEDQLVTDGN